MKKTLAFSLAFVMTLLMAIPVFALPKKATIAFPLGEFGISAITDDGKTAAYDAKFDTNGRYLSGSTVEPGKSIYFPVMKPSINPDGEISSDVRSVIMIPPEMLFNKDIFTFTADKGKSNSKMISSVKLSTKKIANEMDINGTWIEVKLASDKTGKKFKISPSFIFTAKKDLTTVGKYTEWTNLEKMPLENRVAVVAKAGDTVIFSAGSKIIYSAGDYYVLAKTNAGEKTAAAKKSA